MELNTNFSTVPPQPYWFQTGELTYISWHYRETSPSVRSGCVCVCVCVCVHVINDFIYRNWNSPYCNIFDCVKYVIKKKNLTFIKTNYRQDRTIFNSNLFPSHTYAFKFLTVCTNEYMSHCLNSKWMMLWSIISMPVSGRFVRYQQTFKMLLLTSSQPCNFWCKGMYYSVLVVSIICIWGMPSPHVLGVQPTPCINSFQIMC